MSEMPPKNLALKKRYNLLSRVTNSWKTLYETLEALTNIAAIQNLLSNPVEPS